MTTCTIQGIPVVFPFEPYPLQKDYMAKVIDCLQNEQNGVLESPTGTGKTLSLLCSSLAWLSMKKAQMQLQNQSRHIDEGNEFMQSLQDDLSQKVGRGTQSNHPFSTPPTIIYASRTHSQLTQAMQELKRTAYNHMKATIIGSREQMCIHPEVMKEEQNIAKVNLCRLKVLNRSCHFYNRIERKKADPAVRALNIMDIEDLVKLGTTHKFCPYYMAKELKEEADIVFMPYNYLLDPKAKKALGIELYNNIIILDEAHNVEKLCEDSASMQIKSTDIAVCIEEVSEVMKAMRGDGMGFGDEGIPKDFCEKELCDMKEILLNLEKTIDEIQVNTNAEMTTFDGSYMLEILGKAGINDTNFSLIMHTIEKMVQFLTAIGSGPFQRTGNGLQLLDDLLRIVFTSVSPDFREKIKKCYKVHISEDVPKKKNIDVWLPKVPNKRVGRVISYWCFSPGFGMNMLLKQGVKCVILTSGTLAPLKPLISELELQADIQLINPHIINKDQVCVKIIPNGPDNEILNCSFRNRNNPKYKTSLGCTILNICRTIPGGLLIFFPSYPILRTCQDHWQQEGIWSGINSIKTIYIEPRDKESFNIVMNDYYKKIGDSQSNGAIFMGVCRGKVSEGLDFADMNGRAVMVIGLPYPPIKEPKVILKMRYLDICNAKNKQSLGGEEWYSLEATRAVNQAIGRVIRHKNDYGAILLLDSRFNTKVVKSQLSKWLQDRIQVTPNFGSTIREMRSFFKNAEESLPLPGLKPRQLEKDPPPGPAEFSTSNVYQNGSFNFSSPLPSSSNADPNLLQIQKRTTETLSNPTKRKKITIVKEKSAPTNSILNTSTKEYIVMVQEALEPDDFKLFLGAIRSYHEKCDFDDLVAVLDRIFSDKPSLKHIVQGLSQYIKGAHRGKFEEYWMKIR